MITVFAKNSLSGDTGDTRSASRYFSLLRYIAIYRNFVDSGVIHSFIHSYSFNDKKGWQNATLQNKNTKSVIDIQATNCKLWLEWKELAVSIVNKYRGIVGEVQYSTCCQ